MAKRAASNAVSISSASATERTLSVRFRTNMPILPEPVRRLRFLWTATFDGHAMYSEDDKLPNVPRRTASPISERYGTDREIAFGWAVAYAIFSLLAALGGFYLFALATAGISVALIVFGAGFHNRVELPEQSAQRR